MGDVPAQHVSLALECSDPMSCFHRAIKDPNTSVWSWNDTVHVGHHYGNQYGPRPLAGEAGEVQVYTELEGKGCPPSKPGRVDPEPKPPGEAGWPVHCPACPACTTC